MTICSLCEPNLGPILLESSYWKLVLNKNQNLLGKCFLSLRRHLESVPELQFTEWADLQRQLKMATHGLLQEFEPDHFNYSFLQNQDRHIHLHIIPRYAGIRVFSGMKFTDSDFPAHYRVPASSVHLAEESFAELAKKLQRRMAPLRSKK